MLIFQIWVKQSGNPGPLIFGQAWVRIQKPVVTYDIVSYNRKAVCLNLFAALPNVFLIIKILPLLFNIANVIFEVEMQYLGAITIKTGF
jgi:hypothetical protein